MRGSGVAEHASHRVKQIDWQAKAVCESARPAATYSEQTAHLKLDQRKRYDFPRVIARLQFKPERMREAPDALRREKPQMLWRRHQPPIPASKTSIKRGKIPRSNHDHSSRIQMLPAKGQGALRVGKMFNDIQQYDDIEHAKLRQNRLLSNSVNHEKTAGSAKRNGCIRDFNSGHIIKATGFFQEESISASDFQKPSVLTKTANELHRACKFTSQDRLAAAIIDVTVPARPGEIIFGIVAMNVKTAAFGAAETALGALQNVTGVF